MSFEVARPQNWKLKISSKIRESFGAPATLNVMIAVPSRRVNVLRFETFLSFSPNFILKKFKDSKSQNSAFPSEIGIFLLQKKVTFQQSVLNTRINLTLEVLIASF